MSIERELLKKVISGDNKGDFFVSYDLYKEIYEFLAQPEQEPEAWIIVNKETGYRTQVSDLTPFLYHREIFEVIPLYTAPPKREPLINIYVLNAFKADDEATHPYSYWAGVEFAEKHHGIGGEE
jgi:hypothetical protein